MALAQFVQNDLLEPRLLGALLDSTSPPMVREQGTLTLTLALSLTLSLTLTLLTLTLTTDPDPDY